MGNGYGKCLWEISPVDNFRIEFSKSCFFAIRLFDISNHRNKDNSTCIMKEIQVSKFQSSITFPIPINKGVYYFEFGYRKKNGEWRKLAYQTLNLGYRIKKVINSFDNDNKQWIKGYVKWEIGLLSSIGFSLDLKKCAVTGQKHNLYYVSPKTGKAVSKQGAGKFAPKLLKLPMFLGGPEDNGSSLDEQIIMGLNITTYFFKNKLLPSINDTRIMNLPNSRDRLENMLKKL